jgi:guanylate kinase
MPRYGKILVFVGPSGAGKTTIAKELINYHILGSEMITSLTTRSRRSSDLHGEYSYRTLEELQVLDARDELLWCIEHNGVHYATTIESVKSVLNRPFGMGIMILTPEGLADLKEFVYHYAASWLPITAIFLHPFSESILRARMLARGDDPKVVEERLERERNWLFEAKESVLSYRGFIDTSQPLRTSIDRVFALLQPPTGAS